MNSNERLYFERIIRRVRHFFPNKGHILDIGCREGHDALLLLEQIQCKVTGVDIEAHPKAWQANARPDLSFVKASAEKLPFADASFDAVWAKDALHHMDDPLQALRELTRVSKPGAPVVIIEANRYNPVLYVHMTLMEGHEHFSRRKFRALLHQVDPAFSYFMMESRCLPWTAQWIWRLFEPAQNMLEALKVLNPWLTYQVAVVQGRGGKKKQELSKKPTKLKV